MPFTFSVSDFHVPATPGTFAWPPSTPSVPTSRATRMTSPENALSWSTILLTTSLICRISPCASTVILRVRSPSAIAVATRAHVAQLHGQVRRHAVHVLGEIAPRAGHAFDARLAAQLSFRSHFLARRA